MPKPPVFFIVIIMLIVVVASFRYLHQRREQRENDAAPLMQQTVQVASRHATPAGDRRSRQQEVIPAGQTMRYEVWFVPQNGSTEIKMRVTAMQYRQLTVGDKGVLSYKGTRFVSFVPAAPHLP